MALFMIVLATAGFLLVRYIREKDAARQRNLSMIYGAQNLTINQYNEERGSQSGCVTDLNISGLALQGRGVRKV